MRKLRLKKEKGYTQASLLVSIKPEPELGLFNS